VKGKNYNTFLFKLCLLVTNDRFLLIPNHKGELSDMLKL